MASEITTIQVFTQRAHSPRLRYVLDFIFGEVLQARYTLLDAESHIDLSAPVIDYRPEPAIQNAIKIWDCGQLDGRIVPEIWDLPSNHDANRTTGDIFAEIFFHLSRMEEYEQVLFDEYGRHLASESYLGKKNALASPRVDELVDLLRRKIEQTGQNVDYRDVFRFTATYDVDYPWLFLHRGWRQDLRGLFGDILKGRWAVLRDRLAVWRGRKKDPYDQWDEILALHHSTNVPALYFLLLTDRKGVDPQVPYFSSAYRKLLERLEYSGDLGWHPGFYSLHEKNRWSSEKNAFEDLLGKPPVFSRQHYLRIEWPKTYRQLLSAGIKSDYSLAYADQPGFRAGTCHPFFWYDLEKETATTLKLYPLAFMDVSFNRYLKWTPEKSFEKMINIEQQVRKFHGHLIGLWHNSSFYEKEGWSPGWKTMWRNYIKRFK